MAEINQTQQGPENPDNANRAKQNVKAEEPENIQQNQVSEEVSKDARARMSPLIKLLNSIYII